MSTVAPERVPGADVPEPVDPRILNPAPPVDIRAFRRRLRLTMFLWSLPVVLIVLLVALKMLSLPFFAGLTQASYDAKAYERSALQTNPLSVVDVFEPWVSHFDRATALAQIGVLDDSRKEFLQALAHKPANDPVTECVIRTDLVLVIEEQGDAAVLDQDYAGAAKLYKEGQAAIKAAPKGCFQAPKNPKQPDTSAPLKGAQGRLGQKEQQAQAGPGGQNPQGGGGDQSGGSSAQAASPDPLQQLQQQGEDAQRDRDQSQDRQRYDQQNPEDYSGKPW